MTGLTKPTFAAMAAFLISNMPAAPAQDRPPAQDNTKVNQRDRSKTEPTADQGKNNAGDRETMQKIRKSIVDDKSLSTYAHNVKVIAQGGRVTLKGPVRSEDEKHMIEQKASEIAGSGNVDNRLTVKPEKNPKP